MPTTKQPPILEDLRNHSQEQVAELRLLLTSGAPSRPDPRRPGAVRQGGERTQGDAGVAGAAGSPDEPRALHGDGGPAQARGERDAGLCPERIKS